MGSVFPNILAAWRQEWYKYQSHMKYWMVILGGSFGALGRFLIFELQQKYWDTSWLSTLTVNLIGCFGLGVCFELWHAGGMQPHARHLWMVGFFASFTTFSTFAMDLFVLIKEKQHLVSISYVLLSVLLGVVAFYVGIKSSQLWSHA